MPPNFGRTSRTTMSLGRILSSLLLQEPIKKVDNSCFMGIKRPDNWDVIVNFAEAPRTTYKEIREARPDQAVARKILQDFIENCKCRNTVPQEGYIKSMGLSVGQQ